MVDKKGPANCICYVREEGKKEAGTQEMHNYMMKVPDKDSFFFVLGINKEKKKDKKTLLFSYKCMVPVEPEGMNLEC